MTSARQTSLLQPGDKAPDIVVVDVLGTKFDLSKVKRRFVLLAFMRYSGCPWCNLAIHRMALEYPTFQSHDCEIVAFIQSDEKSIVTNIHKRHALVPQFPIVADPGAIFYELYGVQQSKMSAVRSITKIPKWVESVSKHGFAQTSIDGNLFTVPAYFLIDTRQQTVASADYGKSFYDHDTFVTLYEDIFFNAF